MRKNMIRRAITFYSRSNERLVGEVELQEISLPDLRAIFQTEKDDEMVEVFPITIEQMEKLLQFASFTPDTEKYDYFLESYAE